jgi:DNA-directed RNA polymerase subunit RPC12/RpoP
LLSCVKPAHRHEWQVVGGRVCPKIETAPKLKCTQAVYRCIQCGQTQAVYRCIQCGQWDYGDEGGPADEECRLRCEKVANRL